MRVLIVDDNFVTAEVWKHHLRKELSSYDLEFVIEHLNWPDEPFLLGEEISEYYGSEDRMVELVQGVDVLVTQLAPVTGRVLQATNRLKIIGCCRTGPVNINVKAATERGIPVIYAPGRNASAVAEFTIGLILAEIKNICRAHVDLKKGIWRGDFYRYDTAGPELSQLTVGLIGLGAIGRMMVPLLRAFGSQILVYDPYLSDSVVHELDVQMVSLNRLLAESDIVSLHARVTPETEGMMGEKEFGLMKPTACFINTARGPLVDYQALYQALQNKMIAGAALDCFGIEPIPEEDPLLELNNVTITPHIGGASQYTAHRAADIVAKDIANFLSERPLINQFLIG